jgi:serine/threonine protein kinase
MPSNVIGAGTYGTIVRPAAPNINSSFEDTGGKYVTKVFNSKEEWDRTVSDIPLIKSVFPSYNVTPYKKVFDKTRNLGNQFAAKTFLEDSKRTNNMYAVRMPYLGMNLQEVCTNKDGMLDRLRTLNPVIILEQMVKCMEQVYLMNLRGYLHRDIKNVNIVINDKGIINVIDFDLFISKQKSLGPGEGYVGYYWMPPESFLQEKIGGRIDVTLKNGKYVDDHGYEYDRPDMKIVNGVRTYSVYAEYFKEHRLGKIDAYVEGLRKYAVAASNTTVLITDIVNKFPLKEPEYQLTMAKMVETFDSFGLALAFRTFIKCLYPTVTKDKSAIDDMVTQVLTPLSELKQENRKSIYDVYAVAVNICRTLASQTTP